MNIPDHHQAVMPYLILNDAGAFLNFVLRVFDTKTNDISYREDNKTIILPE